MKIIVRKAVLEELKTIQDLNHKLFLWDFDRDPNLNVAWPHQEAGREYFTRRITGERGTCFIAEYEGKIIGYVAGSVEKNITPISTVLRGELENIYIEEEFRSKGAGKLLTNALIDWCKSHNAQSIVVSAYIHNEAAVEFYKARGFKPLELKLEKDLR